MKEASLSSFYPAIPVDKDVVITGKLRIELPEARLRGMVKIRCSDSGKMRIHFKHSNIFGTYEEDLSLLINGSEVLIFDRKRDLFYSGDSSLSMIKKETRMDVSAEDLPMALLLHLPRADELKDLRYSEKHHGAWKLEGIYKGRKIELRGNRAGEPIFMRQCEKRSCYIIDYEGYEKRGSFGYPSYIRLSDDSRDVSFSIEVSEVRLDGKEPSLFRKESIFRRF